MPVTPAYDAGKNLSENSFFPEKIVLLLYPLVDVPYSLVVT